MARSQLYGRGFTLYGLLDDIPIDREDIQMKVRANFFDLVLFGGIWRNWEIYKDLGASLRPDRTVLLDGEDVQNIFLYSRWYLTDKRRALIPRGRRYLYFKRELTMRSLRSQWYTEFAKRTQLTIHPNAFCWLSEFGITNIDNRRPQSDAMIPAWQNVGRANSPLKYWRSRIVHKLFKTYGRSHWATHVAIGVAFSKIAVNR